MGFCAGPLRNGTENGLRSRGTENISTQFSPRDIQLKMISAMGGGVVLSHLCWCTPAPPAPVTWPWKESQHCSTTEGGGGGFRKWAFVQTLRRSNAQPALGQVSFERVGGCRVWQMGRWRTGAQWVWGREDCAGVCAPPTPGQPFRRRYTFRLCHDMTVKCVWRVGGGGL